MTPAALTPVFVGLRTALHVLFAGLIALAVVRAIAVASPSTLPVIALSIAWLATYALGPLLSRHVAGWRGPAGSLWLLALCVEWMLLAFLSIDAVYLVFPLFFLFLFVLPRGWGTVAVLAAAAVSIVVLGLRGGWSVAVVIGPLVGAGVAIVIGLGYQSLAREAAERERLMAELVAARDRLAATERESGVLAERARLARDIHDTVAQGLSSIQMLLHAAEREDPQSPGIAHIRLARETAANDLAETRRFIRELAPAALVDQGLGAALRRLAGTQWSSDALGVHVRVADSLDLPMQIQTAFLRIAQGAMANVIQHARARSATISITCDVATVRLAITDDGVGFDLASPSPARELSDSFGLVATRERVHQLGGTLSIETSPGRGTSIVVELTVED